VAIADPSIEHGASGRTLRRVASALGGLLLACLIAFGALELIDLASQHSFDVRASYAGVRSLEVDGDKGDVHLTGAPAGSDVGVVEHVTEGVSAPRRGALRGTDGALRLTTSCSIVITSNCSVSYTIAVPPGVDVNARSGGGDVDARGLSGAGSLKLSSGNGDVSASGISAGNVTLQSGNGGVTATLSQPATRLQATSGNGDVNLTVPNTTYAVHVSSGNGTVSDQPLRIDPNAPRTIVARSGNGDVSVQAAGATR
jgi:hypothetical protein